MATKFKKGDLVEVISGKDKGKQGKILKVEDKTLIVDGVSKVTRHARPTQKNPKGVFEKNLPINRSKVLLVDPKTNKGGRVGTVVKDNKKIRVFKKTGSELK